MSRVRYADNNLVKNVYSVDSEPLTDRVPGSHSFTVSGLTFSPDRVRVSHEEGTKYRSSDSD